nr:efflux RND transporter periplasmic adaptor subunit [Bacillus piscicola]
MTACQSADVSTTEEEVVPVETTEVLSGSLEGFQKISATTEALSEVALTPEISADIEEVRVKKGETVKKGQVLAVLDDTDLRNALEQEKAAYERAKSGVTVSKAGKKGAEAGVKQSQVALQNADHAIAQAREQYEQAKTNLAKAKENEGQSISAAKRSLETAKRSLETAKRNLKTAEQDRDRNKQLFDGGLISKQEMERAEAAVDDAKDNVSSAEDSVTDAKDNLKQVKQTYDIAVLESQVKQAKAGWEDAKSSKKELAARIDSSKASVEEASGGIQDANAALEQARISVEQAREDLENAVVRAPSSGKVLSVNGEPGELYSQQEPLVMLGEMTALNVTAAITPQQLMLFTEGDTMKVRFPSIDKEVNGTVTYVADSTDDNGMFPVEVQIANPNGALRAGIYGEFLIEETYIDDSLLIPTEALIEVEGQPSVFVVEEEVASLVPVDVLREESDITAVEAADLKAGQSVVTRGQYFLDDGAKAEDVTEVDEKEVEDKEAKKEDENAEETKEKDTSSVKDDAKAAAVAPLQLPGSTRLAGGGGEAS